MLMTVFVIVKKHHSHANSYKRKHLMEAGLKFQRFSPLLSQQGARSHAGRHDAGEDLRVRHPNLQAASRDRYWACRGLLKPQSPPPSNSLPTWPHLHQGHTYSNRVIPLNPFKQRYYLVTKPSNLWAYAGDPYLNHHNDLEIRPSPQKKITFNRNTNRQKELYQTKVSVRWSEGSKRQN